jgi:hypothetical protein
LRRLTCRISERIAAVTFGAIFRAKVSISLTERSAILHRHRITREELPREHTGANRIRIAAGVGVARDRRVRRYGQRGIALEDVQPVGPAADRGGVARARHGAVCCWSEGGRVRIAVAAEALGAVLDAEVEISGTEGCAGLVGHGARGCGLASEDSRPNRICITSLVVVAGERGSRTGGCCRTG